MKEKFFNGQIEITGKHDKQESMRFVFKNTESQNDEALDETLMVDFKDCNFSNDEKQLLSREHRKKILKYKTLCVFEISKHAEILTKKINNHSSKKIHINAKDAGTYICLASILSGQIDSNKKISFQFNVIPLKFFPKKLIRSKIAITSKNITISFYFENKSWIKPFQSLYKKSFFYKSRDTQVDIEAA